MVDGLVIGIEMPLPSYKKRNNNANHYQLQPNRGKWVLNRGAGEPGGDA